jgi:uncharacterized protein (DUF2147 family)
MKITLATAILLTACGAAAQSSTPAGLWQTVNEGGQREALVRITEVEGELRGHVVTVFSPPAPSANPLCEECPGELKNKPVVGLQILSGMRWDGERYSGGEILDPDNGRFYSCTLRLVDEGRKLEVRGFIGISLFGRTQTWLRQ